MADAADKLMLKVSPLFMEKVQVWFSAGKHVEMLNSLVTTHLPSDFIFAD